MLKENQQEQVQGGGKVMNKIIFIILIGLFLPLVSSITCRDSFDVSNNYIEVCNYCEESNGSICSPTRECNVTIFYQNYTNLVRNESATNLGDGSFVYNITQDINGTKNLTEETYIGEFYCGPRSRDDFSFNVYSPAPSIAVSGGSFSGRSSFRFEEGEVVVEIEKNRIPNDIIFYSNYVINKLHPNERVGKIIFSILLIIIIFSAEIFILIKKVRLRKKW